MIVTIDVPAFKKNKNMYSFINIYLCYFKELGVSKY